MKHSQHNSRAFHLLTVAAGNRYFASMATVTPRKRCSTPRCDGTIDPLYEEDTTCGTCRAEATLAKHRANGWL